MSPGTNERDSMNRHQNALSIQEGACNPSGIAHALVDACRECISESVTQSEDAAVRLIVHQLAHLTNVRSIDDDYGVYEMLVSECNRMKARGIE